MKKELSKVFAVCHGSGMIRKAIEYPDLADQQWCSSCENGRVKAERVEKIVRRSLSEGRVKAA